MQSIGPTPPPPIESEYALHVHSPLPALSPHGSGYKFLHDVWYELLRESLYELVDTVSHQVSHKVA